MESLNECRAALHANKRVCTALSDFYDKLLKNPKFRNPDRPWTNECDKLVDIVNTAITKIDGLKKPIEDMIRRINMMIMIGRRREDTVCSKQLQPIS
jgi:hypothetical protein